jgi:hypothetical protein
VTGWGGAGGVHTMLHAGHHGWNAITAAIIAGKG